MIVTMTKETVQDINKANQPFDIVGKLDISYKDGVFVTKEIMFDTVIEKQYPSYDGACADDYIKNDNRIA